MEERKKEKNKTIKRWALDIIYMVVGCMIMAVGTSMFLLPNKLSSGGFTGIATIIYYIFHLPLGMVILALNVPLFIMALMRIGKDTTIKGIIGTFLLSIFIDFFEKFGAFTDDKLLASIYGGICIGLGTAIILKARASTGGTDMLSYIVRSYMPHFRMSNVIVIADIIIVLLNVIVFKQVEIGLYSAIAIYINGKMIDIVFEGIYFTKNMFIVSDKYKEIAQEVGDKLNRGSTAIYAKGMYTKEKKMMLWCVGSRTETALIKDIAIKIDPKAFVVISNAREAWGKGFRRQ